MRGDTCVDMCRVVTPSERVLRALARGIPLTLLADLADPAGPDSRHVYATETADLGWLRDLAYPTTSTGVSDRAVG